MVGSGSNHWEFCEGEPRFQNTIPKKGGSGLRGKKPSGCRILPACFSCWWTCSQLLMTRLLHMSTASFQLFPCLPGHSLSLCGSSAQAPKSSSISSSFLKCVFAPRLTLVSLPVPQISTLCASPVKLCSWIPCLHTLQPHRLQQLITSEFILLYLK